MVVLAILVEELLPLAINDADVHSQGREVDSPVETSRGLVDVRFGAFHLRFAA